MYTRMSPYLAGMIAAHHHIHNPQFTGNIFFELVALVIYSLITIFGTGEEFYQSIGSRAAFGICCSYLLLITLSTE